MFLYNPVLLSSIKGIFVTSLIKKSRHLSDLLSDEVLKYIAVF